VVLVIVILLIGLAIWWWYSSSSSSNGTCTKTKTNTPIIDSIMGLQSYPSGKSGDIRLQESSNASSTGTSNSATSSESSSSSSNSGSTTSTEPPTQDLLSDPSNSQAIPSIWIGEVGTENNGLDTPTYGYFYPRQIGDVTVRPTVNAATLIGNILYAHVKTPGLEGIYSVDTSQENGNWKLYASTGTNPNKGEIDCRATLDSSYNSLISDLYTSEGALYIVTPTTSYKLQQDGPLAVESGVGMLGADNNGYGMIYLSDDGNLTLNGSKQNYNSNLRVRTDIPSYIKYIHGEDGTYAVITTDERGRVGYATGRNGELSTPTEGNVKAFGALNGKFCCVDQYGRVLVNEYDNQNYNFKYSSGIPYRATIPVGGDFELAVALGAERAFIFSCYKEGPQQQSFQPPPCPTVKGKCRRVNGRNPEKEHHDRIIAAAPNVTVPLEPAEVSALDGWESN